MSIKLSQLANEITKQLEIYSKSIDEEAQKEAKRIAKEGVKKLKSTSPKESGDYAASWSSKKVKDDYVLYNKDHYQLTHLLERPHLLRNGKKSTPQPHIEKVEKAVIDEYLQVIERVVQQ